MKMHAYILICLAIWSCGNSKDFTQQDDRAYEQLKSLVASKQLEIVSHTAKPMVSNAFMQVANTQILGPGNTASNINISNTSNSLKIKGDTIVGYFPFYGEQDFGGTLNSNHQGIEFNNVPDDYHVRERDAKHTVEIQFGIDDQYRNNEHYRVFITLFPNNASSVRIQSTNRSSIEFSGQVKPLAEGKEAQE